MKICLIANANSVHTQRWISPLIQQGHEIHLISYVQVDTKIEAVNYVDLTRLTNIPKLRFIIWGRWLRKWIRIQKPDILNAHQIQAAGWLGVLANYHPFIVSSWGSDLLVEPTRSWFRRFLVSVVLHNCDRLTVPSKYMYDTAITLGLPEEKLRLIPWGGITGQDKVIPNDRIQTRLQWNIQPDARVILSPRSIQPISNIDILIESFKVVSSMDARVILCLIKFNPDSNCFARLIDLINKHDLEKRIIWIPTQSTRADMDRLYRMSDLVVSIPTSEGFGVTVYEAMASGCPTLITDLPVFDHFKNNVNTIKIPVRDLPATVQSLTEFIQNDDKMRLIGDEALNFCNQIGTDHQAELVERLYQELIDSG